MTNVSDALRFHCVTVKDYSVTTGTSQYGGYYYGDVNVAIASASLIGYSVRQSDTNMPVILIRTRSGDIRAFSTQSNYTVDIRCLYLGILTN